MECASRKTIMKTFSGTFDIQNWHGHRVKQCHRPEEVFCHLIDDLLHQCCSGEVQLSLSKVRGHGDAVLNEGCRPRPDTLPPIAAAFGKTIVIGRHEQIDDGDPAKSLRNGWNKIRDELRQAASDGWHDPYQAWQSANGFVYVVSHCFETLAERDALLLHIRSVFKKMRIQGLCNIAPEHVLLWDWADCVSALRQETRLIDAWLGVDESELRPHALYRKQFNQFQRYLLEARLPFIPPDQREPTHPACLLQVLKSGENLMLVGAGGAGKTRTCFEVAELAAAAHWRVLHLQMRDGEINLEALQQTLVDGVGPCLLVIDYFDLLQGFDIDYWNTTLLPAAQQAGVGLSVLATRRPQEDVSRALAGFFSEVELLVEQSRYRQIADSVQSAAAPTALAVLGGDTMHRLCGDRPIVALLIAIELEKLACQRQLTDIETQAPGGDLLYWIRRCLTRAGLCAAQSETTDSAEWAAFAVLAAAPLLPVEMIDVAAATLRAASTNQDGLAQAIVATLAKAGWLEPNNKGEYRTPHTVVADVALSRMFVTYEDQALERVFAAAILGKPLGRFVIAARRVRNLVNWPYTAAFSHAVADWLGRNSQLLGQHLLDVRPAVAAYALGAVMADPLLADVALYSWKNLVERWLLAHGAREEARHLLYGSLKRLGPMAELREPCLVWLIQHGGTLEACFIIGPLLAWPEPLLGSLQTDLLRMAQNWLRLHGASADARFVLEPLLRWPSERQGDQRHLVLQAALIWLVRLGDTADAQYVLHPLLGWAAERLGNQQVVILSIALTWLRLHGGNLKAGYIFHSLLGWWQERLGGQQNELLNAVLLWLKQHGARLEAGFVFRPLLNWGGERLGKLQTDIQILAQAWLDLYVTKLEAEHVLVPLMDWSTERFGNQRAFLMTEVEIWLKLHVGALPAGFVLARLLAWPEERVGDKLPFVLASAQRWLQLHMGNNEAQYVVRPLLNQSSIAPEQRRQLSDWAILKAPTLPADDASFLLKALLQAFYRYPGQINGRSVFRLSWQWVRANPGHRESRFVAARLLRLRKIDDERWREIAVWSLELLNGQRSRRDDDFILSSFGTHLDLLTEKQLQHWLDLLTRWLREASTFGDAQGILKNVVLSLKGDVPIPIRTLLERAFEQRHSARPKLDWTLGRAG